jgi:hypothetical protein
MELVFKLGFLVGLMNSFLLLMVTRETLYPFTFDDDVRQEKFLTTSRRERETSLRTHNNNIPQESLAVGAAAMTTTTKALISSSTTLSSGNRATDDACVSTLNQTAIPAAERGFMLFTAPPNLVSGRIPDAMQSWRDVLQGKGTYVVITNDPPTRRLCQENGIATLCVENSDENLPLLDKMYERMGKSQPNGIIAFVNSDIYAEDVHQLHDFLARLQNTSLEVHRPMVPGHRKNKSFLVCSCQSHRRGCAGRTGTA